MSVASRTTGRQPLGWATNSGWPVSLAFVRRSKPAPTNIILLIVGTTAAALFAAFDLSDELSPLAAPLPLALLCVAIGVVPMLLQASLTSGFDLFEPIHLAAAAFTLLTGIRALYLIAYQSAVYTYVPADDLLSAALSVSIVGILAVYLGYYSGLGDRIASRMRPWRALWIGEWGYPGVTVALAALVGLAGMAVLGREIAGLEAQHSVLDTAGMFWLVPLSYCAPFALYMMLFNLQRSRISAGQLVVVLALVAVIVGFFLLRPAKNWLLRICFYPLVIYHYRKHRLPLFRTAAAGLIIVSALMLIGVATKLYLGRFGGDAGETLQFLNRSLDNPRECLGLLLSRFYGIDAIAVIIEHVNRTGHFLMGSSLAEMFYWFVPRALWPGKPYTFSYAFGALLQSYLGWGGEAYATTTVFGELYFNFGLLGVLIGSFLFGAGLRAAYVYLIRGVGTRSAIVLYAIILMQAVEFTEGPVGAHVALSVSEVAPFVMLLYATSVAGGLNGRARHRRVRAA